MRHTLILLLVFVACGCGGTDVLGPRASDAQFISPIPSIPVAERDLDLVTKLSDRADTLKETTEINGAYVPAGTVVHYQEWEDVNKAKYLIILIYDYPCNAYGPPPPGHDYDLDCFDSSAWVAPKLMGDPTDTDPGKRYYVVLQ